MADMAAYHAVEHAADKDHDTLGDGHDVAGDGGHVEGERGAALVQRAEQHSGKHDPNWMTAAKQGYAIPAKPAPAVRSAVKRCCAPNSSLIAIRPAKAPPLQTASRMIRGTRMPAACAASALRPAARIS